MPLKRRMTESGIGWGLAAGRLSDSGQVFTVRVTVTGDDYGNTGTAEAEFEIALLGDINNDGVVNVADRSIANASWRTLRLRSKLHCSAVKAGFGGVNRDLK